MSNSIDELKNNAGGLLNFDSQHYLWHLHQIGVVKEDFPTDDEGKILPATRSFNPELFPKGKPVVKVALIDSGVDDLHPNLDGALPNRQVDFGPHLRGVTYGAEAVDQPSSMSDELSGFLDSLKSLNMGEDCDSLASQLKSNFLGGHINMNLTDPAVRFGSHGTSCAGLVAGRQSDSKHEGTIAYCGANPFCELVSYATPYSFEILPIVAALICAYECGAEVILLPRAIPDPVARAELVNMDPNTATRLDGWDEALELNAQLEDDLATIAHLTLHKKILEELLEFIAERRYLVLAAGNDGFNEKVGYPASELLKKDNRNVIVVGARNFRGEITSYSDGRGDGLRDKLVWMPSDEAEVVNEHQTVKNAREFSSTDFPLTGITNGKEEIKPLWGVLSLDIRENYGYSGGTPVDPPRDFKDEHLNGLYAMFGGTSAASSLAAGMISLLLQNEKIPPKANTLGLNANEMKSELRNYYSLS